MKNKKIDYNFIELFNEKKYRVILLSEVNNNPEEQVDTDKYYQNSLKRTKNLKKDLKTDKKGATHVWVKRIMTENEKEFENIFKRFI